MAQRSIKSFFTSKENNVPKSENNGKIKSEKPTTETTNRKRSRVENDSDVIKPAKRSSVASPDKTIVKKETTQRSSNGGKKSSPKTPKIEEEKKKSPVKSIDTNDEDTNSKSPMPVKPKLKEKKNRKRIICSSDSESEQEKNNDIKLKNATDKDHDIKLKNDTDNDDDIKLKNATDDEVDVKNTSDENISKSPPKKDTSPPKKDRKHSKTPESIETKSEESNKNMSLKTPSGDGTSYNPAAKNYHPIENAIWKRSDKVPYLALARTLEEIENISARLKMIEILSNFFRSVLVLNPADLLPSVYLCLNKLAPAYEGLELGVAETNLMKAIAQSTGRSVAQIKKEANATGDLGIVAEQSRSNQRMMFQPAKLTVKAVFDKLKDIAQMSGHTSMAKKVDKIQSMFVACRNSEARFLVRSLAGKLRIGLAEQSLLQALALACVLTPPEQKYPPKIINVQTTMSSDSFKAHYEKMANILKTTYCECPNYDLIIPVLLSHGIASLPKHCKLTPGIPLKPMLANPSKGVQEVLQRFDGLKFTCEWKYDGERAQIHISENEEVTIYSRNQENNTSKYPDIISRIPFCKKDTVTSCILDCEAVAWDRENKQILPFQILSTRKRKDATEADIKVQVCVFMFDLLYLNGKPLVREPLMERRRLLHEHFMEKEGDWCFATAVDTNTMEEVQDFLEESVKGNCEGLMVKTLESDATYEIAKRSRNWLKLKKDYLEGVGDTLDVVVIGGYLGRGKRAGAYGGFLMACYDQVNEEYQSICKLGTGFSDDDLQKHADFLKSHVIPQPKSYYRYDTSHEPDHWFDAVQVWEIKCADLSLSPAHRAGMGIIDPEKGISLRFPRFVRIREDKTIEEATSAQQVADMYSNQDQIKNQQKNQPDEEDFY